MRYIFLEQVIKSPQSALVSNNEVKSVSGVDRRHILSYRKDLATTTAIMTNLFSKRTALSFNYGDVAPIPPVSESANLLVGNYINADFSVEVDFEEPTFVESVQREVGGSADAVLNTTNFEFWYGGYPSEDYAPTTPLYQCLYALSRWAKNLPSSPSEWSFDIDNYLYEPISSGTSNPKFIWKADVVTETPSTYFVSFPSSDIIEKTPFKLVVNETNLIVSFLGGQDEPLITAILVQENSLYYWKIHASVFYPSTQYKVIGQNYETSAKPFSYGEGEGLLTLSDNPLLTTKSTAKGIELSQYVSQQTIDEYKDGKQTFNLQVVVKKDTPIYRGGEYVVLLKGRSSDYPSLPYNYNEAVQIEQINSGSLAKNAEAKCKCFRITNAEFLYEGLYIQNLSMVEVIDSEESVELSSGLKAYCTTEQQFSNDGQLTSPTGLYLYASNDATGD